MQEPARSTRWEIPTGTLGETRRGEDKAGNPAALRQLGRATGRQVQARARHCEELATTQSASRRRLPAAAPDCPQLSPADQADRLVSFEQVEAGSGCLAALACQPAIAIQQQASVGVRERSEL